MKKALPVVLLTSVALGFWTSDAAAQQKNLQVGGPAGGQKLNKQNAGQYGRRNDGLGPGQRGIGRPPIGQGGMNRPRLDPARKREIQQHVMQAIGLTPDQRFRMQEIRRGHEEEVIAVGRRIRQARQALDRAIMNENYDEHEVRRATDELAAAQTEKIKLDAAIRGQVRNVLTTDQVIRFHQLQREMRREQKQQQQEQEREGMALPGRPMPPPPQDFDLLGLLMFDN